MRKRILYFFAWLVVVGGIALYGLSRLGGWLQIDEPVRNARSIVVFGGGVPFRAMEAANLYQGGWAKEVWLTRTLPNQADRAAARVGVHLMEDHEYNSQVLAKLGVPESAIHVIPEPVDNTLSEIRAIVRYAESNHPAEGSPDSVILVTSKYHTRRVRVIWDAVSSSQVPGVVRYSAEEKYEAQHWWSTTTDAIATFREAFGILNAWAGFPIAPRER